MKRICAYCRKEMGEKEPHDNRTVTHGICEDCLTWFQENTKKTLRDYLDTLEFPVLLVDSNVDIQIANARARETLGNTIKENEEISGGEAVECAYARMPGGCGQSIHCKTCAIRISIEDTYRNGTTLDRVPATLQRGSLEYTEPVTSLITTEKLGDLVLLKIETA